jgi:predicted phage tail protein
MTNDIHGAGGGGGGSQHTPVESPDSLRSLATFRILDLISEGEIAGLVNGQQSIFLNETPLANSDGSLNFQNVQVDARNGTQTQDVIKGYTDTENEIAVGVELKSGSPWVQSLSNTEMSAVRVTLGWP